MFAFHSSKVSVMPICLSPYSTAASSISYLKYRTRNDYLCPEISSFDSSVNSFGKQMLIHHISLTRIQNWLPWHQLNCEWQTLFQDFDKLVNQSAFFCHICCVFLVYVRSQEVTPTAPHATEEWVLQFTTSPWMFSQRNVIRIFPRVGYGRHLGEIS